MSNASSTQLRDRLGHLLTELVELIGQQSDDDSLKTLRLVNGNVKSKISKPFARRFLDPLIVYTTPAYMEAVFKNLAILDFTKHIREVRLKLQDFRQLDRTVMLLRAGFVQLTGLKAIRFDYSSRADDLTPTEVCAFTDKLLLAIEHASLPKLKELRLNTSCYDLNSIQACIEAHEDTLRTFEYKSFLDEGAASDNFLRFIMRSSIETLVVDE